MWDLDHNKSWVSKNWFFWTVVLEKTLESPLDGKEIKPVNFRGNQSWIFIGSTDDEAEAPMLWPPDAMNWPWCWKRLKTGGEGDVRGWDGWMAEPTGWTWLWASSGRWWWTGKSGVLQAMKSQRARHDWATNWTEPNWVTIMNSSVWWVLSHNLHSWEPSSIIKVINPCIMLMTLKTKIYDCIYVCFTFSLHLRLWLGHLIYVCVCVCVYTYIYIYIYIYICTHIQTHGEYGVLEEKTNFQSSLVYVYIYSYWC